MVECEVCDRSHVPNHPHIANIEGDIPIDDADPHSDLQKPAPVTSRELPDWLKDKPGSKAIRPAAGVSSADDKVCQVCGKLWAPRHACKGAEQAGTGFNRPVATLRQQTRCDTCGKVKRSNPACKKQIDRPVQAANNANTA